GHLQRGADVEGADPGVRVRAAQRGAPQHVLGPHVGGVGELAANLEDAVRPDRALADPALDRGSLLRCTHCSPPRSLRTCTPRKRPSSITTYPAPCSVLAASTVDTAPPSITTLTAYHLPAVRARLPSRRPGAPRPGS